LGLATNNSTLSIRSTSSILQARIAALSLIAALIAVAIGVHTALELHALLAGLAFISIRAVAEHPVLGHSAKSIPSASLLVRTRIGALSIDTTLVGGTITVGLAPGNACASLAKLTHRTLALGSALIPALSSGALLSTGAILGSRALGGTVGSIFVAFTVRMTAFRRKLTASQTVSHKGGGTLALDSMVDHKAVGTLATLAGCTTWILALLVHAGLVGGTTQIGTTSSLAHSILANLSLSTCLIGVAYGSTCSSHATLIGQAVLVVSALSLAAAGIA